MFALQDLASRYVGEPIRLSFVGMGEDTLIGFMTHHLLEPISCQVIPHTEVDGWH